MGVIVVRPVVADVAEVGFDRPVAAVEHEHLRLGADKLGMRCTGVARAAERHRHLPALPGGVGIVERIAILPQRHLKLVPRTSCRHANRGIPGIWLNPSAIAAIGLFDAASRAAHKSALVAFE